MSTPPPTFENYPPARDAGPRSGDHGGASERPEQPLTPVFAPPGGPPPPAPGPNRRGVLTMIGGGVAVLIAMPVIASIRNRNPPGFPEGWESGAAPAPDEDEPEDLPDNQEELGDYTVTWPDGWSVDGRTEIQLALARGGVTVIFRAYTVGDDVTATEEAQRLLNRHTAGLGKRRTNATDTGSERASIEASGTRGDGVRVDTTVHVVIDGDERNALAVIALVPAGTVAARRDEITRMRRDFLDQLG